jgi:hypothetical protein
MRRLVRSCAILAACALIAPAAAQVPAGEAESGEIVVKGQRDRNRDRQISDFIGALTKAPIGGQLSRFEQAVCPSAMGLAPAQNGVVEARMRKVAEAAGAPVGKKGCKPNAFVVVAQDKEEWLKAIRASWSNPAGERVKIPEQSGSAVALHLEGVLDANGVPVGVAPVSDSDSGGYYVVEMGDGSSRIRPASRRHFLASILIVEPDAVEGLTTTQLADYAVMRLLARVDPSRLEKSAAPTILTILDAPMDSQVPVTMSHWDLAFLKALYTSGEGRYANQQRSEMKGLVRKELDKAQSGAKN